MRSFPKYEYIPNPEDEAAPTPTWCRRRCAVSTTCATWCVRSSTTVEPWRFRTHRPNVTIGFACVDGQSVGIVANQPMNDAGARRGCLGRRPASCASATPSARRSSPSWTPPATVHRAGAGGHHLRRGLHVAYANATVPMVTVILRGPTAAPIVMGPKSIGATCVRLARRSDRRQGAEARSPCTAASLLPP